MISDTELANRVAPLVNADYALGDISGSAGWDCLSSLIAIYREALPVSFEGFDASNYAQKWKEDEKGSRRVLEEFLTGIGKSINQNYRRRGDLILLETKDPVSIFPVVDLGDGKAFMMASKVGGQVFPVESLIRMTKTKIVDVRRIFVG